MGKQAALGAEDNPRRRWVQKKTVKRKKRRVTQLQDPPLLSPQCTKTQAALL